MSSRIADPLDSFRAPVAPTPVVPNLPVDTARWSRLSVSKHHLAVNKFLNTDLTQITAAISTADAVMVNPDSTDSQVNAAAEQIQKLMDDLHALTTSAKTAVATVHDSLPPKMTPAFVVKDR